MSPSHHLGWAQLVCVLLQLASSCVAEPRHRRRHVSVSIMYPVDISPISIPAPCICIMYRHHADISGELAQSEDNTARFHHHCCYQTQMRQSLRHKVPNPVQGHTAQHTSIHIHIF